VGDILLQASEDHGDAEGPITSILLPLRVKRLQEALGLQGFSQKCNALSKLLTSSLVDLYKQHLRNTAAALSDGAVISVGLRHIKQEDFKAWVLSQLASHVDCITPLGLTLLHDLPGKMMVPASAANVQRILDSLKVLLDTVKVLPAKVLMEASVIPLIDSDTSVCTLSVEQDDTSTGPGTLVAIAKASCCLHRALSGVPPPLIKSDIELEKMCLECARVVFCTVSSSGRRIMQVHSTAQQKSFK
jgi:hypothetical protein